MLHLLMGRDWTANRDEIMNRIALDVRQKKGKRILIVPELISHDTERRLCAAAGDTASRYAEVLSFSRLARRVSDGLGTAAVECLDEGGRVVAMASAARQLSSRLKAYASVETKPEFLLGLIDGVDEFKRCCITAQDLMYASEKTEGSLSQKLEELSLLMGAYDSLCSRGKRDPRDLMAWLLEHLEDSDFVKEHTFYIDGFPDFTRQNMEVVACLIRMAPDVTISLNCDQMGSAMLAFEKAGATAKEIYRIAEDAGVKISVEWIPGRTGALETVRQKLYQGSIVNGEAKQALFTYCAPSAYDECMAAAETVLSLVKQGCRYRDITLVCTDIATYRPLIDFVFHRFHIPVYQTGTEEILQKSVISTVLTALDAALCGFEQKEVLQYLRSALSPLEPDLCDYVENYAITWGIRGKKWLCSWQLHPDGLSGVWDDRSNALLERLEQARIMTITPLEHLQRGFQKAGKLRDQVEALYGFLEEIRLEERLARMAEEFDAAGDNRNAQILNQLWDILLAALEQLYDVLGETVWESAHFSRLLRLLLSQYKVGTIPPVLDAVQVGPVSAMRCNQEQHLIVIGAEEGKLPGYSGSSGVLTDQERVELRDLGVPLTGGAMEGIQAEFAEIYGVFCGAEQSIRVYYSGEQPSFVCRRLSEMAGSCIRTEPILGFALADAEEAGAYLAQKNQIQLAKQLEIEESYNRMLHHRGYSLGSVTEGQVRNLYGTTLNLSASQIDRQAECRFSYFLKYGLRAKERKEAAVDPAEFGTYVHAVLENTARTVRELGGFHKVSLEETLEIAHRYSEEYAAERFSQIESERMSYLFRRNVQELDMVVAELWLELKDSLFEPCGFEVGFGEQEELAPIPIPNRSIQAILRGFIDRVDIWQSEGSRYYRVVDYKTGRKDFDYCDVFNGVGLQMLLYMFTLRNSGSELLGGGAVPAGVQYFPARVPYISSDGWMDEEQAQKERGKLWKRNGLLLQDQAVLQAMEPGEQPVRMCYKVNKDGTLSGDLADRDQMRLLEGYVFRVLARMVEDIASGNVEPNPYTRGSSHNACRFCPYGSICHEESVAGRRDYAAMKRERFWEEIGKEMSKHGG
ncbi:MAG: exodeoxyribonuclease V subunit gamma [Oscillospiraceae bacterium]|nr:exodeoxyribonuclease V subunit gamma [Oscillospiraceae bacterium]